MYSLYDVRIVAAAIRTRVCERHELSGSLVPSLGLSPITSHLLGGLPYNERQVLQPTTYNKLRSIRVPKIIEAPCPMPRRLMSLGPRDVNSQPETPSKKRRPPQLPSSTCFRLMRTPAQFVCGQANGQWKLKNHDCL